jgi:hypothetical protein
VSEQTFFQFKQTRERITFRNIISTGDEVAASYLNLSAADLLSDDSAVQAEVKEGLDRKAFGYRFGDSEEFNKFIEIEADGSYYLILGNTEYVGSTSEELEKLEQELFEWGEG